MLANVPSEMFGPDGKRMVEHHRRVQAPEVPSGGARVAASLARRTYVVRGPIRDVRHVFWASSKDYRGSRRRHGGCDGNPGSVASYSGRIERRHCVFGLLSRHLLVALDGSRNTTVIPTH